MIRDRLKKLEAILQQRSAGSNWAYLRAIQRDTDRVRAYLNSVIETVGKGSLMPEKPPSDQKDLDIINAYEAANQTESRNKNGRLDELLSGIKREEPGPRQRVENKIVNIHKRLKAGEK